MILSNRIRIFSELVSLEAWHLPFTARRTSVGLHADITFSTARLGAEDDSPVRFKLRLKEAVLTVIVPDSEPIAVDRSTVARFDPAVTGVQKRRVTGRKKGEISAALGLKGGGKGLSPSSALHLGGSAASEVVDEATFTRKHGAIIVHHSIDEIGNNKWRFTPGAGDTLSGKPWSPNDTHLFKFKDTEPAGKRKLEPSVRLELSCLREDLDIFDITFKDSKKGLIPLSYFDSPRRLIAAEAFIRTRLQEEGLPAPQMSEDYALITLARTNSVESG